MGKYWIVKIIFLFPFLIYSQIRVNVKDFGANGDDNLDDFIPIQKAIDKVLNMGGGEVYFPSGNYLIKDRTLLIWGKNLELVGENKLSTVIKRIGNPGWWGELISISGKVPGGKYHGGMGTVDYERFVFYEGKREPAENITLKNITLSSDIQYPVNSNNLGIVNSRNVVVDNCIMENAPQSNIAIVNDTDKASNDGIVVKNCILKSSGQHSVRVISYNQGSFKGNSVIIENCVFSNVLGLDRNKEIKDRKIHLWYRAGSGDKNISLTIDNCKFDKTGDIITTVNTNNLKIIGSRIDCNIIIKSNRLYKASNMLLSNNIIGKKNAIENLNKIQVKEFNNKLK